MNIKSILVSFVLVFCFACPAFSRPLWNSGDNVEVEWKGRWWNAYILETEENRYKIHYDGWDKKWDEWVGADRIRTIKLLMPVDSVRAGEKVQVEWKGKWWSAEILEVEEDRYKVHYDGWKDTWDEWVTIDRIRK